MGNEELKGCHPGGDPVGLKGPDGMNTFFSYQAGRDDMITTIKAKIEQRMKSLEAGICNEEVFTREQRKEMLVASEELSRLLSVLDTLAYNALAELSASVDNYPKNVCPPSVECEKGMREPLESEKPMNTDEMIRKKLIGGLKLMKEDGKEFFGSEPIENCISYLEKQSSSSEVPNDLEEYASRAGFDYVDNIVQEHPGHRFNDHDVEYAYRDGIIAGAKWKKGKMMKEAVPFYEILKAVPPGPERENVRIIIVKED